MTRDLFHLKTEEEAETQIKQREREFKNLTYEFENTKKDYELQINNLNKSKMNSNRK